MFMKEVGRREIEKKLEGMGDYVRIHYLTTCLKNKLDLDTKKFVLVKLGGIYEQRKMFNEAGKIFRLVADIEISDQSKIKDYLKSGELFIKTGNFEEADFSFGKALGLCDFTGKQSVKDSMKEYYKVQAKVYLLENKRKYAADAYERLLTFSLPTDERVNAQKTLLDLYNRLGKMQEWKILKSMMDGVGF